LRCEVGAASSPSLLEVADAGPPFWPRVVDDVTAVMSGLDAVQPVVLAHSNAGLFLPLLAGYGTPVAGCRCDCQQ